MYTSVYFLIQCVVTKHLESSSRYQSVINFHFIAYTKHPRKFQNFNFQYLHVTMLIVFAAKTREQKKLRPLLAGLSFFQILIA